ncbi:MAG: flagellar filament capping protein FliD [Poseidonibacter sp.]|uniref:flagellar filament capping protein FliD n=1 Tax=Poseidonibacter sp. TaxID=2321188 RepID=UPI00359E7180
MAEGVLGMGSGQASALNSELIDKLKAAERKARVEPIEKNIENIELEKEVMVNINLKVSELLDSIKPFDLFISGGGTAFDQKAATTSGDSVVFDAVDVANLNKGITSVNVTQLSQKDVYQSNTVTSAQKDTLGDIGTLTISVNGTSHDFNTADYATYDELKDAINVTAGINASFDQVGTDSFRLILKSEESGLDNALTISGTASQALGFTTDGTTVNNTNHILTAQNMNATIDGVDYDVSTNSIEIDGLKITANKLGESSINITDDKSQVTLQMQSFVDKYNELVTMIDDEVYNGDSAVGDKSALRNILDQLKDKLFGEYGTNDDKSVFNYGLDLDKSGKISLDVTKFNSAVENNLSDLKDLLVGSAEKEGLGTQLKSVIDEMKFSDGILSIYDDNIDKREETLTKDKEKAEESLKSKYQELAAQFAAYGSIINSFESSFSGLKMMIAESTSS